jgi:hypothetical protein
MVFFSSLLEDLPAVTLAMAWDEARAGWVSTVIWPLRFPFGQLVATLGALRALNDAGQDSMPLVARHRAGDWGKVPEEDRQENACSLQQGCRLLSPYNLSTGVRLWVMTDADRSATTMLWPEAY